MILAHCVPMIWGHHLCTNVTCIILAAAYDHRDLRAIGSRLLQSRNKIIAFLRAFQIMDLIEINWGRAKQKMMARTNGSFFTSGSLAMPRDADHRGQNNRKLAKQRTLPAYRNHERPPALSACVVSALIMKVVVVRPTWMPSLLSEAIAFPELKPVFSSMTIWWKPSCFTAQWNTDVLSCVGRFVQSGNRTTVQISFLYEYCLQQSFVECTGTHRASINNHTYHKT